MCLKFILKIVWKFCYKLEYFELFKRYTEYDKHMYLEGVSVCVLFLGKIIKII